jgi:hypothetical protein
MTKVNHNANIVIIEESQLNAYYQVTLGFLPNIGDFITLTSLVDIRTGHESHHELRVDQIIHEISDIDVKSDMPKSGFHFVTILASRVDVPEVLQ